MRLGEGSSSSSQTCLCSFLGYARGGRRGSGRLKLANLNLVPGVHCVDNFTHSKAHKSDWSKNVSKINIWTKPNVYFGFGRKHLLEGQMRLFIKPMGGTTTFTLDCKESDTIEIIREKIKLHNAIPIPTRLLRLYYGLKEANSEDTLASLGIEEDTTLALVVNCKSCSKREAARNTWEDQFEVVKKNKKYKSEEARALLKALGMPFRAK